MNQSGYYNQGGFYSQSSYPGGPIQHQPSYSQQMSMQQQDGSFHPGYSQSFHPGQFQQGQFQQGQFQQGQFLGQQPSVVGYSRQSSRMDSGRFGASQNFSAQQLRPGSSAQNPSGMFQARSPNEL